MGYLSANLKYYLCVLEKFEKGNLNQDDLYLCKQVLRSIDDLLAENYTFLPNYLEENYMYITRIKKVLSDYNEEPFAYETFKTPSVPYQTESYELESFLKKCLEDMDQIESSSNPFLKDVKEYAKWIGYQEDTAYIFLFRDALLPYLYFQSKGRKNLYPWLISRRFIQDITRLEEFDDDIREPIYCSLDLELNDFKKHQEYCREEMKKVISIQPKLKKILEELLSQIKEEKIIVVESGYMGTIPMLLSALDERVDIRMFTTAPYLYKTYQDKIYCQKFELMRNFETLKSQDLLLQYDHYDQQKFYVNCVDQEDVYLEALKEIKTIIK